MTPQRVLEANSSTLLQQLYELDVENVSDHISAEDMMFENNRQHYFSVAQSAMRCIKLAMLAAGKDDFRTILDFGCGHGRVMRVLRAAFPAAKLTACDLLPEAAGFCGRVFDAEAVCSTEQIERVRFSTTFDLIWCGTVLTNVDSSQFVEMLALFHSLLNSGGILVFTVHGSWVSKRLQSGEATYGLTPETIPRLVQDYDLMGFGYADYPRDVLARLGIQRYGISLTSAAWVCSQLRELSDLHLLTYTERAWDNHQDSVACVKQDWFNGHNSR